MRIHTWIQRRKSYWDSIWKKRLLEFTPIDVSKLVGVTNKTIINSCAKLTSNGFLIPNIVRERIRSYSLSEFAKRNEKDILSKIGWDNGCK